MPPSMASARKVVAVPFVGKDVPSQAAEFAHPEVLIGLTILAYRYEGLRAFDVREIVTILKELAVREVGAYEHRKSNKLFQQWHTRATAGSETTDLSLQTIQIEEPKQLMHCWQLLQHLPDSIYYFLNQVVFPKTMHSQINKISASGQALGSSLLFRQRIGFSGTPSSLLPTEFQPCHFEVASEGKIISTLCDPMLMAHTIYPRLGKQWTVEGLLQRVANGAFGEFDHVKSGPVVFLAHLNRSTFAFGRLGILIFKISIGQLSYCTEFSSTNTYQYLVKNQKQLVNCAWPNRNVTQWCTVPTKLRNITINHR
eukprot:SAG11_NODE_1922_length_4061_cov_13.009339_5_plen_312_part_00